MHTKRAPIVNIHDFSVVLTGAFLFATTTARTSNTLLGWNCGYTFASNVGLAAPNSCMPLIESIQVMYGVLYAISPEIFPAKDRGTGNGLTATATRVFSLIVSVSSVTYFELFSDLQPTLPRLP